MIVYLNKWKLIKIGLKEIYEVQKRMFQDSLAQIEIFDSPKAMLKIHLSIPLHHS